MSGRQERSREAKGWSLEVEYKLNEKGLLYFRLSNLETEEMIENWAVWYPTAREEAVIELGGRSVWRKQHSPYNVLCKGEELFQAQISFHFNWFNKIIFNFFTFVSH